MPPPSEGPTPIATHSNHIWLLDLTTIRRFVGRVTWSLACVFDAYARLPRMWHVFAPTPTARDLARLVRRAVLRHGRGRHLITDWGA